MQTDSNRNLILKYSFQKRGFNSRLSPKITKFEA